MQACQESIKDRNTLCFLLLGQKNKAFRIAVKLCEKLCCVYLTFNDRLYYVYNIWSLYIIVFMTQFIWNIHLISPTIARHPNCIMTIGNTNSQNSLHNVRPQIVSYFRFTIWHFKNIGFYQYQYCYHNYHQQNCVYHSCIYWEI